MKSFIDETNGMLSVIVLSYKNGSLLFQAIDSVLKQTYESIEIIVANDCDGDFDVDAVCKYIKNNQAGNIKRAIVYKNPENYGTTRNMNEALKKSSGQFIKFIAADDVYPKEDVFSKQIKVLNENDGLLCVGNTNECDESLNYISTIGLKDVKHLMNAKKSRNFVKAILRDHIELFATQAICFKRTFFVKHDFFDERLFLIEDLPLAVKILTKDVLFVYLDYPVVSHRQGVGISSKRAKLFDSKRMRYYEDLVKYYELILYPYRRLVGLFYYKYRFKVALFRVEYIKSKHKFLILLKYLPFLVCYLLKNNKRFRRR